MQNLEQQNKVLDTRLKILKEQEDYQGNVDAVETGPGQTETGPGQTETEAGAGPLPGQSGPDTQQVSDFTEPSQSLHSDFTEPSQSLS